MTRRHRAGRQRILEPRHHRTHPLTIIGGAGVLAGLAALPSQQITRWFSAALLSQLALPPGDAHL